VDEAYVDERYPLSALTARMFAAAMEVHAHLGPGFEEVIYQRALERELPIHGMDAAREEWIGVVYKGVTVGRKRVDFLIGDASGEVLVEIKAKAQLDDVDLVQTLSYLRASGHHVGLLINFGGRKLEVRRLAN